jgi:thiol-disulfide isomerase/thioredoxin
MLFRNVIFFISVLFFASCSSPSHEKNIPEDNSDDLKNAKVKVINYYGDTSNSGKLNDLIKAEIASGKKPLLYFTASWCGPCKAYKRSLSDPMMADALKDATLIMIDEGEDAENLLGKYGIGAFPTYIKVNKDGYRVNQIDGGAWDDNTPENMAPVFTQFLKD